MKKLVLALTAVAAFTGSAFAADLPARTYTKAPVMPEPVYNWTGFYIFGGAGGGVWDADSLSVNAAGNANTITQRTGGDGWFGTVGAGYDWQFNHSWVAGIFADGQFGSLRGSLNDAALNLTGTEKLRDTWAVGGRIGYLVAPNVYSYVNAGYTTRFKGWTAEESQPLLKYLYEHAVKPEYSCRFRWATNSLALWDNRCAMHKAVNDYLGQRRVMHRVAAEGDRPT